MTWEYEEVYNEIQQEKFKRQKPFIDKAYKFIEENNCKKLTDGTFRHKEWDIYPNKLFCKNYKTNEKMSLTNFYKFIEKNYKKGD